MRGACISGQKSSLSGQKEKNHGAVWYDLGNEISSVFLIAESPKKEDCTMKGKKWFLSLLCMMIFAAASVPALAEESYPDLLHSKLSLLRQDITPM